MSRRNRNEPLDVFDLASRVALSRKRPEGAYEQAPHVTDADAAAIFRDYKSEPGTELDQQARRND